MTYQWGVCPKCGEAVTMETICPGVRSEGKWLQCYPACGNAALYECTKITCGWWFIDGMHKKNALFRDNETRRPAWLAK